METLDSTATNEPHHWVIQHCLKPGCSTAIRSHDGLPESQLVCKWCRASDEHGCHFAVYPTHRAHEENP